MHILALSLVLCQKEGISPLVAHSWAWRIQNEYPESLRQAAEAWAMGEEIPPAEVVGETLDQVIRQTGANVPEALELMYVMSRDPAEGLDLLARSTRRDNLGEMR